ncbi:MAG: hypothetical protein NVSMB2_16800 [Chloroflexota bacterium]
MVPLQAGGSQLWQSGRRLGNRSFASALAIALVTGAVLAHSSLAGAQAVTPGADPSFFPATGYRIASPPLLNYFQRRGGIRTFGYPISNEFPLLGQRVQLFQRQMLQIAPDGTVTPGTILDPSVLPIDRIDGLNLPPVDPDLVASAPSAESSMDFTTQALSFVSVVVPDTWQDLPVNFQTTFLNSVTCADAFGSDPCDASVLPAMALELWGLPTSLPTADPLNSDFVYQRFERGIMHFSKATSRTQGLLVGDWLKRVIVGTELSPDLSASVRNSRFYAQYAPSRPLALDRPSDLPDTSLAQAFKADALTVAQAIEATLPPNVAMTATAVAQTATAVTGTQISLQGTQTLLTATALAGTATALANPPLAQQQPVATAQSNIPVVNLGCMGDEQMWFIPPRPRSGVHVQITVTSQRHHDARALTLAGPIDPGPVTERVGPLGFMWTWTVQPTVQDFYEWTFYADGLRPCITSGFNSYTPLGSTPTPTNTPQATNTPGPTATATPQPAPQAQGFTPPTGGCGDPITIFGSRFGAPQTGQQVPNGGRVLFGSRDATIVSWTDGGITIFPPAGTSTGTSYTIIVINSGGSSTVPGRYALAAGTPTSSGNATTC